MLSALVPLILFVSGCAAVGEGDSTWYSWQAQQQRFYRDEGERVYRYAAFQQTKNFVDSHNARVGVPFRVSLNQFADLTPDEKSRMHGAKVPPNALQIMQSRGPNRNRAKAAPFGFGDLPNLPVDLFNMISAITPPPVSRMSGSLDWREKGAVTPVRVQGQCGSCWAIATTGAIESRQQIKTGIPLTLSPQHLVDCSPKDPYYTFGCDGGWPIGALMYVNDNGGANSETDYPYTSGNGRSGNCSPRPAKYAPLTSPGYVYIEAGNETGIMQALQSGPVVATMYASLQSFYSYSSGVYLDMDCPSDRLNHAVLIVGYGTDTLSGLPYWLIKNSWGTAWGEQGYFRLARNGNTCGILTAGAAYPLV